MSLSECGRISRNMYCVILYIVYCMCSRLFIRGYLYVFIYIIGRTNKYYCYLFVRRLPKVFQTCVQSI